MCIRDSTNTEQPQSQTEQPISQEPISTPKPCLLYTSIAPFLVLGLYSGLGVLLPPCRNFNTCLLYTSRCV